MTLKLTVTKEHIKTRAYIDQVVAEASAKGCDAISLADVDEISEAGADELVRWEMKDGVSFTGIDGSVAETIDAARHEREQAATDS